MHTLIRSILAVSLLLAFGASNSQAANFSISGIDWSAISQLNTGVNWSSGNVGIGTVTPGNVGIGTITPPAGTIQITNCQQLQDMKNNLSGNYVLANDIDCSSLLRWNDNQKGLVSIGTGTPFKGSLDGQNHKVSNLMIRAFSSNDYSPVGLFGALLENATVKNLILENVDVQGLYAGAIAGSAYGANVRIENVHVKGTVAGTTGGMVGGLIGSSSQTTIFKSSADVNVRGSQGVVGGLIGNQYGGVIQESFSTGRVSGCQNAGGLVGGAYQSRVVNTYSTANVEAICNGSEMSAGIAGLIADLGGLPGQQPGGTIVEGSFAAGAVSAGTYNVPASKRGGMFAQYTSGGLSDSLYWDTQTSGQSASAGLVALNHGRVTQQMKQQATFAGFDFVNTWRINENQDYPHLKWEPAPIQITNCQQLQDMKNNLSGNYVLANDIDCSDTKNWNSGAGFIPVGNRAPFNGTFDGQNHHISNLFTAKKLNANQVGLFAVLANAKIKNVYLDNFYLEGPNAGVLAASAYGAASTIENVHVSGKLLASGLGISGGLIGDVALVNIFRSSAIVDLSSDIGLTGGFVGFQNGGSIKESYAKGNVLGCVNVGGFIANSNQANGPTQITNNYSLVNVTAMCPNSNVGGFSGGVDGGAFEFNFATGNVSLGTAGVSSKAGGLFAQVTGTPTISTSMYWNKETTGQTNSAGVANTQGKTTAQMKQQATFAGFDFVNTWRINENQDYPHLKWEPAPIQITNCQQLQDMRNNLTGNYVLANDIDCTDTKNWNSGVGFIPIGASGNISIGTVSPFKGTLDGNNYAIKGLYTNLVGIGTTGTVSIGTTDPVGVFSRAVGSTIKNVNVVNASIQAGRYNPAGGVVGELRGNSQLDNVHFDGTIVGGEIASSGGLVWLNLGSKISKSSANVTLTSGAYSTGGLVGDNYGDIDQSFATGRIISSTSTGGLVGSNEGNGNRITDSYAAVRIDQSCGNGSTAFATAGLLAYNSSSSLTMQGVFAAGTINVAANCRKDNMGGLVGRSDKNMSLSNAIWDKETTLLAASAGSPVADGKTSAQMKQQTTFAGFDFVGTGLTPPTWKILNGLDYPHLAWENYPKFSQISQDVGQNYLPRITGNTIVWQEVASTNPVKINAYYYNILTRKIKTLNSDANNGRVPRASDKFIIWFDSTNSSVGQRYAYYDLKNGSQNSNLINSSVNAAGGYFPAVDGDKIIYRDGLTPSTVYFLDLTGSPVPQPIITSPFHIQQVDISGRTVVYEKFEGGAAENYRIYAYDIPNNIPATPASGTLLSNVSFPQAHPRIHNGKVVWADKRNGNWDIYLYDMNNPNVAQRLRQITTSAGNQTMPAIYGNRIVWVDDRDGHAEIYMYDLTLNKEFRLTNYSSFKEEPAISGDRLVWIDDKSGKRDVYMMDLNFNRETVKFKATATGTGAIGNLPYGMTTPVFPYGVSGMVTSYPYGLNCFTPASVGDNSNVCEMTVDKGTKLFPYIDLGSTSAIGTWDQSKLNAPGISAQDKNAFEFPTAVLGLAPNAGASQYLDVALNSDAEIGFGFESTLKPDLIVDSVTFNPAQPILGQPFQVTVTVKNIGTAPTPTTSKARFRLSCGSTCFYDPAPYLDIPTLGVGQSYPATFTFPFTTTYAGINSYVAVADFDPNRDRFGEVKGTMKEISKTNNTKEGTVSINQVVQNLGYIAYRADALTLNYLCSSRLPNTPYAVNYKDKVGSNAVTNYGLRTYNPARYANSFFDNWDSSGPNDRKTLNYFPKGITPANAATNTLECSAVAPTVAQVTEWLTPVAPVVAVPIAKGTPAGATSSSKGRVVK